MSNKNSSITTPKKFCFVLMPFTENFDDVYNLGIKQSCIDADAYCERVDEQIFHESILDRIFNQISKADIIIADMTNKNPNVFYEVGYAHALGKLTILLTQNSDDIPFDLKHFPHIIYDKKISKLKTELTPRIKKFLEIEKTDEKDFKIEIDLYQDKENLSLNKVTHLVKRGYVANPNLTIHNNSFYTYSPGDFKIGIITTKNIAGLRNKDSKTITMPDGKYIHMLDFFNDILYPNSYISFSPAFGYFDDSHKKQEVVIIRLFTSNGFRDYLLNIEFEI